VKGQTLDSTRPPKIWLANVGANAAHPFFSPRFEDGTFELLPIPETPPEAGPHSVVYADVPAFNDAAATLGTWVPERYRQTATHYDPEFGTLTYGDNVERNARAAALRDVALGDMMFLIVRLADWTDGAFTGRFGFYLAGFLEVQTILSGVRAEPSRAEFDRYMTNAHIRRGLNDPAGALGRVLGVWWIHQVKATHSRRAGGQGTCRSSLQAGRRRSLELEPGTF